MAVWSNPENAELPRVPAFGDTFVKSDTRPGNRELDSRRRQPRTVAEADQLIADGGGHFAEPSHI
jgi:hypothetical protein